MGKFNKGVVLGGLLGAGLMWMSTTKKGREMRDKILDHAADVYVDVKKTVLASDQWKTMTKSSFVKRVNDVVDKYADQYDWAADMAGMVKKVVVNQWSSLQKEFKKKK